MKLRNLCILFLVLLLSLCFNNAKAQNYDIINLGLHYDSIGQTNKALKQYNKAIKALKQNNSEIIQTANYFSSKRLYEQAINTYLKGRQLFKDETKYTYELSYLYQIEGRNEDIAKEYILLLDKQPNMLTQIEINLNNLISRDKDTKLQNIVNDFALEKVQKFPQNEAYNRLYYWLLMQKGDYEEGFLQAKAIDKRFSRIYDQVNDFASQTFNAKKYNLAVKAYEYIINNGKDMAEAYSAKQKRVSCLYNEFIKKTKTTKQEAQNLKQEYNKVFSSLGLNEQTAECMKEYADLLAYKINDAQEAVDILDSIINMRVNNRLKAECKLKRADIYLINGDIWEASLIYSQVEKDFKNETIGSEAKFRNAMLSYYTGDFAWALSQFDVLRSSTTKLIANDAMEYSLLIKENIDEDSSYKGLTWYAKADFLLYQNRIKEAEMYLDSIEKYFLTHPLFDEIMYKRAQIAIKQEDYRNANSLLNALIIKYPYDLTADDAIYTLACLYRDVFKEDAKAKSYFEKLILDYPSSLYVPQARKEYEYYEKQKN